MFHAATRTVSSPFSGKLTWVGSTLFVGCAGPSFAPCDFDALPLAFVTPLPFAFPAAPFAFVAVVAVFRFFATRSSCEESASDPERGSCWSSSSEGVAALRLDATARFGGMTGVGLGSKGGSCADVDVVVWRLGKRRGRVGVDTVARNPGVERPLRARVFGSAKLTRIGDDGIREGV